MSNETEFTQQDKDDFSLMARIANGDEEAFSQLVDKYKNPVVGTISRMLNNSPESEDIAQQVFLRVWKSATAYQPTAKFSTWLFTIVKNLVFNETRRTSKRQYVSHEELKEEYGLEPEDNTIESPEETLQKKEMMEAIDKAINELPKQARMAVILRRYEDMPYEEIASTLNMSVSAVKSLLFRSRNQLKEALAKYLS